MDVALKQLTKKISEDFYNIITSVTKEKLLKHDENIDKNIYNFWKNIGNKNNDPTEIIFQILGSNINNEDGIKLFEKIYKKLMKCNKDNKELLAQLSNLNNFNNIDNFENNNNSEESDELEEQEENEIDNNDTKSKENINKVNIINEIIEEEDSFDKKDNNKEEYFTLNSKLFEALLNSKKINFFNLGPSFIKKFIQHMKIVILDKYLKKSENKRIIATTTEIYKQYFKLLIRLTYDLIIIEEAEKVLKSNKISLLTKCSKQIILFGDVMKIKHEINIIENKDQKTPIIQRLIQNQIPYITLQSQRRMKLIFVEFIKIIYGQDCTDIFKDYTFVDNNIKVKGITKDIFFINHNMIEQNCYDKPYNEKNEYEAKYIVKLAQYLLKQGYKSDDIVILTFYDDQVTLIKEYRNKLGLKELKVKTIENYHGEENNIVLLSLVISNNSFNIGELSSYDKVYKAFSRAKIGFYIIGNFDNILTGDKILKNKYDSKIGNIDSRMIGIWEKIFNKAKQLNIIGDKLILECQNHKQITEIYNFKDFKKCPEGGCHEKCYKRMKCGHACEKYCHGYDCNQQICTKTVRVLNPKCKYGKHNCTKMCYEDFGKCKEIVNKKLLCGHIQKCKCYKKDELIACKAKCEKKLPCGHIKKDCICSQNIEDIKCTEICNKKLPCGHLCQGTCHKCLKGTLHTKCSVICGRILACGHICKQNCSSLCICNENCPNECPHNKCLKSCCEVCIGCKESCPIKCKHSKCDKTCDELCERKNCDKRCDKIMKCGHQCYGLCGERCPEVCRICNPEEECFKNDFFFHTEINEDALIYKTKCDHLFEVSNFDSYINSKINKKNQLIQMFSCPRCTKLLIWEPRYQNLIKNIISNIQKIKILSLEKNFGKEDNTFYLKSRKLVDEILAKTFRPKEKTDFLISNSKIEQKITVFEMLPKKNMFSTERIFEYDHFDLEEKLPIIYNLCKNKFKDENDFNSRIITSYNLLTLAEKFLGIEYYFYFIKRNKLELKEKLFLEIFEIVKDYFKDFEEQFNNFFFKDLKRKIDNMLYYSIIKLIKYSKNSAQITNEYSKLSTEEILKSYFNLDIDLKQLYKTNYIDKESLNLLISLGTKWYKCPNNHLYTVGECGRPMEESICPQCKEKIGGKSHIPASGNIEVNLGQEMNNINNNQNNNRQNKNDGNNNYKYQGLNNNDYQNKSGKDGCHII